MDVLGHGDGGGGPELRGEGGVESGGGKVVSPPPGRSSYRRKPGSPEPPIGGMDAQGDPLPAGAALRIGTTRYRDGGGTNQAILSPDGKRRGHRLRGGDHALRPSHRPAHPSGSPIRVCQTATQPNFYPFCFRRMGRSSSRSRSHASVQGRRSIAVYDAKPPASGLPGSSRPPLEPPPAGAATSEAPNPGTITSLVPPGLEAPCRSSRRQNRPD